MSEFRNYRTPCEVREGPNGPMICGYGVVFNSDSFDMGFIEQVDPGAATKTIAEADIRGLGNHDPNWLLGRVKSGTMRLRQDSNGVWYEIDVNMKDPDGVRAIEKVRRGDWDGSSFSFETIRDQWDWESTPPRRRLLEFKMVDTGPVTFNAYPDATAAARALSPVAERLGKPVASLVAALGDPVELRSLIGGGMSTIDDTATLETEERAGKAFSAANQAAIAEHLDAIRDLMTPFPMEPDGDEESNGDERDLMDTALNLAPADSDVADAATLNEPDDDDENNSGRSLSLLSAQLEMRQRLVASEAA